MASLNSAIGKTVDAARSVVGAEPICTFFEVHDSACGASWRTALLLGDFVKVIGRVPEAIMLLERSGAVKRIDDPGSGFASRMKTVTASDFDLAPPQEPERDVYLTRDQLCAELGISTEELSSLRQFTKFPDPSGKRDSLVLNAGGIRSTPTWSRANVKVFLANVTEDNVASLLTRASRAADSL